ncbi:small ribosomal subunit protein mS81 (rPPR8)-like [Typha angustifolia]|uniref:small ribosomal subunit protein mS81 (rPPR8)-like n=1 Tax=Typha angustifolia TaxID=59011 RepID=UPI003C302D97
MRNAWKSLILRNLSQISSHCPRTRPPDFQVKFLASQNLSSSLRWFSSIPAVDRKEQNPAIVAEIFSKPIGSDEIRAQMESLDLALDLEMTNSLLRDLEGSPEVAHKFFDWVSGDGKLRLNSKSYNLMLEILGKKGMTEEFWGLAEIMKKKGFGIAKDTYLNVSESFEKLGIVKDLNLLKEMYFLNSHENVAGRMCPMICRILRSVEESDSGYESMKKKLDELGASLSSDLVCAVLERIAQYPKKSLMFFRWVEGNSSFKVDGKVYNAMARVLGREDCIEEFWDVLGKIRDGGYDLEKETYVKVSERFHKRKMLAAAVDLYQFAMKGSEKLTDQDFLFLLKKIIVGKDLDLNLVTKVVSTFRSAGDSIRGSVFDGVLKSLRSVNKLAECDKVLRAMEEGGFAPDSSVHVKAVVGLCNAGVLDEALQYLVDVEEAGYNLDLTAWATIVEKHALAGNLDKSLSCFRNMVERKGGEDVGCALEVLVNGCCQKKEAKEAHKVLKEVVTKYNVKPWHSTYKFLIERLISQGSTKEACSLLVLMKSHGFPPYIDPFIDYISKSGTVEDATDLLKSMSLKEFPSRMVFLRLFEGLFKEGRHEVAHGLLSKSPGSVRNHADVLDLFYAMKPEEATAPAL